MRWWWCLMLLACGGGEGPAVQGPVNAPRTASPDVVIALVTGLREDGASGASDAFFDASGIEGKRFTSAYAQSPSPFASLGSMFTGRYVAAVPMCGLMLAGDRVHTDAQQPWCASVPSDRRTLAEVFGIYGYKTAFVTGALAGGQRLGHGFGHQAHEDSWTAATEAAGRWWADNEGTARLLVVVLSDGEGNILGDPALPRFPERKYQWLEPLDPRIGKLKLDAESITSSYREASTNAGKVLGTMLERLGPSADRLAVLGSTNGMSLSERGGFHESAVPLLTNNLLVDRAVRVPLMLSGPGIAAEVDDAVVELVDVFPTLAEAVGAVPPAGVAGESLAKIADGRRAYAEFGDMLFLRNGDHALTFRCTQHNATSIDPGLTETLTDPSSARPAEFYSLYDVVSDPMQERNLRSAIPEVFADLRKAMIAMRTGEAAVPEDVMTPERLWALRMAPSDGYW